MVHLVFVPRVHTSHYINLCVFVASFPHIIVFSSLSVFVIKYVSSRVHNYLGPAPVNVHNFMNVITCEMYTFPANGNALLSIGLDPTRVHLALEFESSYRPTMCMKRGMNGLISVGLASCVFDVWIT